MCRLVAFCRLATAVALGPIARGDDLDAHVAAGLGSLIVAAVGLLLPTLLVRFLYQEKIFIRL